MPARKPRALAMLALCLASFGPIACSERQSQQPPILFISLDTLRRDRLGEFREGESITPHLDAFSNDAVVFRQAFVHVAFTLSSHMAMFTGVHTDVLNMFDETARLSRGVATLAEILHDAGYGTAGLYTAEWLDGDFGFARGFDIYSRLPHKATYSDRLNEAGLGIVRLLAEARKPLFLFLHYYDPHSDFVRQSRSKLPYYSPPSFRQQPPLNGDGAEFCIDGKCATGFLLAADAQGIAVDPQSIETLSRLYDSGVRYLDADLGKLFAALKDEGLYDRALILVTSDHGEEFREHGKFIHSQVYDESIAVPLMIKFPRGEFRGRKIDALVDSTDLLPTLLDYLELPAPAYVQGQSLLPLLRGGSRELRRAVLSQDKLNRKRYALRTADRKLVLDLESGAAELYDLTLDPHERKDLSTERPAEVRDLSRTLARKIRENQQLAGTLAPSESDATSVLSSEERERLRALGYVE